MKVCKLAYGQAEALIVAIFVAMPAQLRPHQSWWAWKPRARQWLTCSTGTVYGSAPKKMGQATWSPAPSAT